MGDVERTAVARKGLPGQGCRALNVAQMNADGRAAIREGRSE